MERIVHLKQYSQRLIIVIIIKANTFCKIYILFGMISTHQVSVIVHKLVK